MSVGGFRKGSGRPNGTSKYKEKTVPVRIPLTLMPYVKILLDKYVQNGLKITAFEERSIYMKIIF